MAMRLTRTRVPERLVAGGPPSPISPCSPAPMSPMRVGSSWCVTRWIARMLATDGILAIF